MYRLRHEGVGVLVVLVEELPVSAARQLVGLLALGLLLVGRQCKLLADETGDRLDGLGDVGSPCGSTICTGL